MNSDDKTPAVPETALAPLPTPDSMSHDGEYWYKGGTVRGLLAQQREAGRRECDLDFGLIELALEMAHERLSHAEHAIAERDATALRVATCAGEFARDAAATRQPVAPELTDEQINKIWWDIERKWSNGASLASVNRSTMFARALLAASPKVAAVEPKPRMTFDQWLDHKDENGWTERETSTGKAQTYLRAGWDAALKFGHPVEPVSDDKRDAIPAKYLPRD